MVINGTEPYGGRGGGCRGCCVTDCLIPFGLSDNVFVVANDEAVFEKKQTPKNMHG